MRIMLAAVAVITFVIVVAAVMDIIGGTAGRSRAEVEAKNRALWFATALESYKIDCDEYPHGAPSEIMRSLLGNNPRKMIYFEAPAKDFNEKGELIDPWQTPYRVEFGDFPRPHVSSAGRNKVFDGDAAGSDDICSWR